MATAPRVATFLVVLLLLPAFAGCLELHVARVPDRLLEGKGGNGWQKDTRSSQAEPTSGQMGLVKTQTLVYEDPNSDQGYPGSLTVATLRTLLRPSEESLREDLQERVRTESERKGIHIDAGPMKGTRRNSEGADSFWFSYNGTVEAPGFFARNARVKIIGEVWQCADDKTVVVAIALAQITDARSIGGVPVSSETDFTTWREIVADPTGKIEGFRGSNGLIYNIQC